MRTKDRGRFETALGQGDDSVEQNLRLALESFDALNHHNVDRWLSLASEDCRAEAPAAAGPLNRLGSRIYLQNLISAFPDIRFEVLLTVAERDHVVVNWSAGGTHIGPWRSTDGRTLETTQKKIGLNGSTTFEFRNGKIVQAVMYFDLCTLMDQLGLSSRDEHGVPDGMRGPEQARPGQRWGRA